MSKVIRVFDTTLRDGEQSPGCSMYLNEKIEVAKQLEKLKVDVIEAGFAIASPGDLQAIKAIAENVKDSAICSLARAVTKDIDAAWEGVQKANQPIIHTFIATSPVHMTYKLRMTPDEVLNQAIEMVKYAKRYTNEIEFSAEDACRSDKDFLVKVFSEVIKAGATTINIPDTVGYILPHEMYDIVSYIMKNTAGIEKVNVSVHCHNDLGMAVANSLAAIKAGARQIECTVNGIGERAGNAALEEIVMNIKTRNDYY
ncbi:MAG: 2-isopropylmalate synthase, partial [Clostridiales bacterium]|nr:2-isopropylmalate synthase [Clostridiales bacterium]